MHLTSFARWSALVLIIGASIVLGSCSHAGAGISAIAPSSPVPFVVTSESTLYAIRGRFVGEMRLTASHLSVTVTQGSVLSMGDYAEVRVEALIGGATATGWRKVAEGQATGIGAVTGGHSRPLSDSLHFDILLPDGFDPAVHWLAFEFSSSGDGMGPFTTYACSRANLLGVQGRITTDC